MQTGVIQLFLALGRPVGLGRPMDSARLEHRVQPISNWVTLDIPVALNFSAFIIKEGAIKLAFQPYYDYYVK